MRGLRRNGCGCVLGELTADRTAIHGDRVWKIAGHPPDRQPYRARLDDDDDPWLLLMCKHADLPAVYLPTLWEYVKLERDTPTYLLVDGVNGVLYP